MPTPPADLIARGLYHPEGWLSEESDRWRWYTGKMGTRSALHRIRSCGFAIHRCGDGTYWFLKSTKAAMENDK